MPNEPTAFSVPAAGTPDPTVIEAAKRQLEQMIDSNPHTMLLVDRSQTIARANQAFLRLAGLARFDQALGHALSEFFACPDPHLFERMMDSGGYAVCETLTNLPGKSDRTVRFTVIGSGRDTELFAVMAHDISDETGQALEQERAHKKEAVRSLMGALMHRINQPLTVIMVRAQLMALALEKNRIEPDDFAGSLQDIMKMTMEISQTLKSMETPTDFATEPYLPGLDILDLNRSGAPSNLDEYSKTLLDVFLMALDAHCPGSALHAKRTGEFAGFLATKAGWSSEQVAVARRCGYFHDLGKIGVPDHILQKPQALTAKEAEHMRRHAEIGYDLLRSFPFLKAEAETAWTHHERPDGKGYPRGLSGADLLPVARIVALADTFDALRYDRAYQPPVPLDAVVETIRSGKGSQFDPDFVDIFLDCCRDMDALFSGPTA